MLNVTFLWFSNTVHDTYSSIEGHEGVLEPKGRVTSSVEFVGDPDKSWPPMTTIKWSSEIKEQHLNFHTKNSDLDFELFKILILK